MKLSSSVNAMKRFIIWFNNNTSILGLWSCIRSSIIYCGCLRFLNSVHYPPLQIKYGIVSNTNDITNSTTLMGFVGFITSTSLSGSPIIGNVIVDWWPLIITDIGNIDSTNWYAFELNLDRNTVIMQITDVMIITLL